MRGESKGRFPEAQVHTGGHGPMLQAHRPPLQRAQHATGPCQKTEPRLVSFLGSRLQPSALGKEGGGCL